MTTATETATETETETKTWTFDLSLQDALSLNDSEHHMERGKRVKQLRDEAMLMAKIAGIPRKEMRKIRVTLTYTPPNKIRRDADNLVPTLKAICDGLVDAGIVPDDTPAEMEKLMPVITAPKKIMKRRFVVTIEQLM